jgi:hypothetical protein
MTLGTEIVVVAVATLALFHAPLPLLQRLLRRPADGAGGPAANGRRDVLVDLAAMVVRLVLAVGLVLGLLLGGVEHRAALAMTVGAAYFASACFEGVRRFRNREAQKCLVR